MSNLRHPGGQESGAAMFKTATSHLNMDTRPGYTVDAINLGCREETIFMTIFFFAFDVFLV